MTDLDAMFLCGSSTGIEKLPKLLPARHMLSKEAKPVRRDSSFERGVGASTPYLR
jgi:hypothetical protein